MCCLYVSGPGERAARLRLWACSGPGTASGRTERQLWRVWRLGRIRIRIWLESSNVPALRVSGRRSWNAYFGRCHNRSSTVKHLGGTRSAARGVGERFARLHNDMRRWLRACFSWPPNVPGSERPTVWHSHHLTPFSDSYPELAAKDQAASRILCIEPLAFHTFRLHCPHSIFNTGIWKDGLDGPPDELWQAG